MRHFSLTNLHQAPLLLSIFLLITSSTSLSTSPLDHHHINNSRHHHPPTTHSHVTSRNLSPRYPFPDLGEPLNTIPAPNSPSTAGDKTSDTFSLRPLRIFSLPVMVFRALSLGGIAVGSPVSLVVVPKNNTEIDIVTVSEKAAGTIGEPNYKPHSAASNPDCTYNGGWEQFPPPGCSAGSSILPFRIFKLPVMFSVLIGKALAVPVQMTQSWAEPDWDLVRKTVNYIFASEEEKGATKDYTPVRSKAAPLPVPRIFKLPRMVVGVLIDCAVAKEGEGSGDKVGYAYTWTAVLLLATFLAWSLWAGSGSTATERMRDGQLKAKEGVQGGEKERGSYDYSIGWHEWAERLRLVHPAEV